MNKTQLEKIEKTRELAAQGKTYDEMATYFGDSYSTVMMRCRKYGINAVGKQVKSHLIPEMKETLDRGMALVDEQDYSTFQAAKAVGVKVDTLRAYINNQRNKKRRAAMPWDAFSKPNPTIAIINKLFLTKPITKNPNRLPAW